MIVLSLFYFFTMFAQFTDIFHMKTLYIRFKCMSLFYFYILLLKKTNGCLSGHAFQAKAFITVPMNSLEHLMMKFILDARLYVLYKLCL